MATQAKARSLELHLGLPGGCRALSTQVTSHCPSRTTRRELGLEPRLGGDASDAGSSFTATQRPLTLHFQASFLRMHLGGRA